jgi:hypothetical protein
MLVFNGTLKLLLPSLHNGERLSVNDQQWITQIHILLVTCCFCRRLIQTDYWLVVDMVQQLSKCLTVYSICVWLLPDTTYTQLLTVFTNFSSLKSYAIW